MIQRVAFTIEIQYISKSGKLEGVADKSFFTSAEITEEMALAGARARIVELVNKGQFDDGYMATISDCIIGGSVRKFTYGASK